jgi:acylglycerol lipase
VHGTGTLIGIYGMLSGGENLLKNPPVIDAPLLVQHGTHDKITEFSASREFFAKLPAGNADREFKGFDGYYHELHNELEDERNVAIKYIADWIVARVGESGAPKAKL